jgi:hypothetical protein
VKLSLGDIRDYDGSDLKGIELCFLDILKTPEVARHAMRVFFPRLLPGAYIVQQDYFFSDLPHIRVFNEALADKMRYLGEVRSSAIFQLMDPISTEKLEEALASLKFPELALALHQQAEARTVNLARQYMLRLSRGLLYVGFEDFAMAERTLAEADRQFAVIALDARGKYRENMAWRVKRLRQAIKQRRAVAEKRKERQLLAAEKRKEQMRAAEKRREQMRAAEKRREETRAAGAKPPRRRSRAKR